MNTEKQLILRARERHQELEAFEREVERGVAHVEEGPLGAWLVVGDTGLELAIEAAHAPALELARAVRRVGPSMTWTEED